MTQVELLKELEKLTLTERLKVVETVLQSIREELRQMEQRPTRDEQKRQLAAAAKAMLPEYVAGGELTIFTALDSEDFYPSS